MLVSLTQLQGVIKSDGTTEVKVEKHTSKKEKKKTIDERVKRATKQERDERKEVENKRGPSVQLKRLTFRAHTEKYRIKEGGKIRNKRSKVNDCLGFLFQ